MKYSFLFPFLALLITFSACNEHLHIQRLTPLTYQTDSSMVEDKSVDELIAPYREKMEAKMNAPIGHLAQSLEKGKPESTLGNFAADLLHAKCQQYYKKSLDFSIVNYGGLRIPSMSEGGIKKGTVFELMPFENELVVMELDGVTTLQLFSKMAKQGGWPISKEARYIIVNGKADEIMIKGQPLDLAATYKVGLTDYLANGGDRLTFLKDKPRIALKILFRDAILEYIGEQKKPIVARLDGRVVEN